MGVLPYSVRQGYRLAANEERETVDSDQLQFKMSSWNEAGPGALLSL